MVHSICIYVILFCVYFLVLFMLLLVDYQNVSLNLSQLDSWKNPYNIVSGLLSWYLPYRGECVGKPCEMVTWPNICYDVILQVNPILNLVMNCTHIITENFSKVVDIDGVSKPVILLYFFDKFLCGGKTVTRPYDAHWILA